MNIAIYIDGQLTDIDDSLSIFLQKEFEDDEANIINEIEYSYDISFPTTIRNKKVFGFIDSFDVPNKFSRLYDAQLYINDVLIIDGKVKLSEISKEEYKGNIYNPANATVSDILGDRQLNEIQPHMKPMNSLQDYNECNNYVIGENTTDIPKAQYRDRHICYPYVLYSLPMNDTNTAMNKNYDLYTQDLEYGSHTISDDNILPSYNVCSVLKDIFATEGYNVIGNIFDDEKFKDLYQTFSFGYTDYFEKKNKPYYVEFDMTYTNYDYGTKSISSTLETATIWSENYEDEDYQGNEEYGVDTPLQSDSSNLSVTVKSNEQKMLVQGQEVGGYTIVVPKTGWYRVHINGSLKYPTLSGGGRISKSNREAVGPVQYGSRTDCGLKTTPFEFQVKKGYPKERSTLYSFNSIIPTMPTAFSPGYVYFDGATSYIKCQTSEKQRLYPKNGCASILKEYSDFSVNDFICGARLGGAWYGRKWHERNGGGSEAMPYKLSKKGLMLALPRTTAPTVVEKNNENYFRLNNSSNNNGEYGVNTAQALVREDSFSNFQGYNKIEWSTKTWDTTSNYNRIQYSGAEDSTASTSNQQNGRWNVDTVVWLEKGDTLYFEVLLPKGATDSTYHGGRLHLGRSHWSSWNGRDYVVIANVTNNFKMGYINSDKDWVPTPKNPIPSFDYLKQEKETNVNQFLPNIKCNDYLTNFLQTFNLQLTMPYKNTFSIDSVFSNKDLSTNIITLDKYANISDATFKVLNTPTTRELNFKIDKSESGYKDGNQSPYKTADYPWYSSGYSGSISITNETNPSNTIDKKESQWSYNWYKTINFINGKDELAVKKADISVIADASVFDKNNTYSAQQGESLDTSKTMRFFILGKDNKTSLYQYVSVPYKLRISGGIFNYKKEYTFCKLLIPSNGIRSINLDTERYYYLDYSELTNLLQNSKSITDIFFNLKVANGYQVDVGVSLPNDIYSEVKGGTLFKFNDGLYRVSKIEGHDTSEYDKATLSLLTLK